MPTAQQLTDIKRQLRQLEPTGVLATEYIDNLVTILTAGAEETVARITADKVFNNDGTLADLTGLVTGTLSINSTYDVELVLRIESASATPGADIKFVIPAGATLKWALGSPADVAGAELTEATTQGVATIAGTGLVTAKGILKIGATAGTIKVQGAQSTPTVEDTKYKVDSNLTVTKIA